jgi:hypothetical protein
VVVELPLPSQTVDDEGMKVEPSSFTSSEEEAIWNVEVVDVAA